MSEENKQVKRCYKCGNAKALSEFNKDKSSKDGHQSRCRKCSNEITKTHYVDNKKVYNKRSRKLNDARKIVLQNYVYEYLLENSCVDCGENNPVVLEFDHVKDIKYDTICKIIAGSYSLEFLKKEIEKCEVRCVNCHRIKSARDRKYYTCEDNISTKSYIYAKKYLKEHPCIDCGESNINLLDFDHKSKIDKISSVCKMLCDHRPLKIVIVEIEKCEVRCGNCHRIKTAREGEYYKYIKYYG